MTEERYVLDKEYDVDGNYENCYVDTVSGKRYNFADEFCDYNFLNDINNTYKNLKRENEQLKTQIKIFEKFLDENNLDINWENFCTVDKCKKESDDYGCKECKYLGDVK